MTESRRRVSIELRRWPLRVTFGVRPTIVVGGRTEPAQWGVGTWLIEAGQPVEVAVFMFVGGIRFGFARYTIAPDVERVEYRAPVLAFLPGRMGAAA